MLEQNYNAGMMKNLILLALVFTLSANEFYSQSWNQFRGLNRDGKSNDTEIFNNWTDQKPELIFKKEIGEGFPEIVVDDHCFYLYAGDTLNEILYAYDVNSGDEKWSTVIDSIYFEPDGWGHGGRTTPVIDGERIYCLSGKGKLKALDIKNGKQLWVVDLMKEYGSTIPRWGFTSSPVLVNGKLVLEVGGVNDRAYVAFNASDGKEVWAYGNGAASYNSPLVIDLEDKTNIVFVIDTMLISLDTDGNEIWKYRMPIQGPIAMPLFIGANRFFIGTDGIPGGFICEVKDNKVTEVLQTNSLQTNWSTAVCHDGYIYGIHKVKLQCISAETGELKWTSRGFGKGSLIIIGDKLLVLSDQGMLKMVEATPELYKELGSLKVMSGKSWTAPSYSNGRIYVRNLTEMSCYQIK
jgi:outer membrane protein assembly factor BamB